MQDLKFYKFFKNPKKFAYNKIIDRRQTAILRLLSLIHIFSAQIKSEVNGLSITAVSIVWCCCMNDGKSISEFSYTQRVKFETFFSSFASAQHGRMKWSC